jgi:hypothetical protein
VVADRTAGPEGAVAARRIVTTSIAIAAKTQARKARKPPGLNVFGPVGVRAEFDQRAD